MTVPSNTNNFACLENAAPIRNSALLRNSGLNGKNAGTNSIWFLTGQVSDRESVRHIPIHSSPFRIGRRSDLALSIPCSTVSSVHAEFVDMGDHLVLRDLRSTNGTYVNGERVRGECVLQPEDLILFADVPFRVRKQSAVSGEHTVQENLCDHALALVQFDRLMSTRSVIPFFQPIVSMQSRETVAYEVLGRSEVFGLETPSAMFRAAAQLDLEVDLSRMFRWESVLATASLDTPPHLYMNTHPNELNRPGLLQAMQAIREMSPRQPLTLEIHEAAVTDVDNMNELHARLTDLEIGLAYDDFGAGQNRLLELLEVRPDCLKFDMSLIRDIHLASAPRQSMVRALVKMVEELGIIPLAEGIESEAEGATCLELGFRLAQGFYYGRPASAYVSGFCEPPHDVTE